MWAYIIRRILLTIPIVLGVVLITILLFSYVSADPARAWAGKTASPAQLDAIREQMGIDKPKWLKTSAPVRQASEQNGVVTVSTAYAHGLSEGGRVSINGLPTPYAGEFPIESIVGPKQFSFRLEPSSATTATTQATTIDAASAFVVPTATEEKFANVMDSQFFDILSLKIYRLNSMRYKAPIWKIIKEKAPASMAIQVPAFIIALGLQLSLALYAASRRGRWQDFTVTIVSVFILSVPALSCYLFAQWFFSMQLGWFPVAGWETGAFAWMKYAALPIFISVVLALGSSVRLYRTVMVDEIYSDYVRTARAKGLGQRQILFTHVLKNGLIPVITSVVTALPALILGALLLERIFQIPGLGAFTVESLSNNDRTVVMGMTFALSIIYCILNLVSDVLYAIVNPQVSLK